MQRRTLLTSLGLVTAGSVAATGTGAFTTVRAKRTVSVEVADDFRALLRLEPLERKGIDGEPTGRSGTAGKTVTFDIPGDGDGETNDAAGVAPDSVYEFCGLLQVVNQGTQPVTIRSAYDGELGDIALVDDSGAVLRSDPPILDVGDDIKVGLQIDTHGSETGQYDETLTIIGERAGGNRD
jgi:hypothetical protein